MQSMKIALSYLLTPDLPLGSSLDQHCASALPKASGWPRCCPHQVGKSATGDLHRLLTGYQVTHSTLLGKTHLCISSLIKFKYFIFTV